MTERRNNLARLGNMLYVLHRLRLPMWFGLVFTSGLIVWWTHWLLEEGNIFNLVDWQLAIVPPIYLALIPIVRIAVEHSERNITKDPD